MSLPHKTEYKNIFCTHSSILILILKMRSDYYQGILMNNTNARSNLFYIGIDALIIQIGMICDMFLYMVNVMEYGIQYFLQIVEHQYFMFNKLFHVYNTLEVDKMYGFRSCEKRTRDKGLNNNTLTFLST
eukprot:498944_1